MNIANRHDVKGTKLIHCKDCWNWENNGKDLPSKTCMQPYFPFPDSFPDSAKRSTGCPNRGLLIKRTGHLDL